MKLNNKGFAISGIMYASLILFLVLMTGTLTIMASKKIILDKEKNDIINLLENRVVNADGDIWLNGFMYRQKIIVDSSKIDSDLTHFPLMIKLDANTGSDIFAKIGNNSGQIAITKAGDNSQLYIEVEKWDAFTDKEAVLYTSSSSFVISSTVDTVLYIYYGAESNSDNINYVGRTANLATEAARINQVWNNNYVMVNHMNSGFLDSTSNVSNGTPTGTSIVSGLNGQAANFNGTSDKVDFGSIFPVNYTITSLQKVDTLTTERTIIGSSNADHKLSFGTNGYLNSGQTSFAVGNKKINTTNYYTVISRYDSSTTTVTNTLNGKTDGVNTSSSAPTSTSAIAGSFNSSAYFDGIIDELRISNIMRSDAWVKAETFSLNNSLISFIDDSNGANWLKGFRNRQLVKIDSSMIDSSLSNFPLTIKLSTASNADIFNKLGVSSRKIAFTKSDGYNQLFAEVDYWNSGTKTAVFHVSSSSFNISDTTDTFVYIYYDSVVANNTYFVDNKGSYASSNVWDNNYVMVSHMGSNLDDSSIFGNGGTNSGSVLQVGDVGELRAFNNAENITFPNTTVHPGTQITISAIANTIADDNNSLFNAMRAADGIYRILGSHLPNSGTTFYFDAGPGGAVVYDRITKAIPDADHVTPAYWQYRKNATAGTMDVYRNDTLWHSGTGLTQSIGVVTDGFIVGNLMDGAIDEFRVSNIERSVPWIKAEYYSLFGTLTTFNFVETK